MSLGKAVDRLLQNLNGITSYFKSLPDSDCPKFLQQHFQADKCDKEILLKMYLSYFSNVSKVFNEAIPEVEKNKLAIIETYEIMSKLRSKLICRRDDNFLVGS